MHKFINSSQRADLCIISIWICRFNEEKKRAAYLFYSFFNLLFLIFTFSFQKHHIVRPESLKQTNKQNRTRLLRAGGADYSSLSDDIWFHPRCDWDTICHTNRMWSCKMDGTFHLFCLGWCAAENCNPFLFRFPKQSKPLSSTLGINI